MNHPISWFKIVTNCNEPIERRKGMFETCQKIQTPGQFAYLKDCKNPCDHFYQENYLEEWIAREPKAIFPDTNIMLVASQNYAYFLAPLDLLFIDENQDFHIVELKIEPVARNGGVSPDTIYEQMTRYITCIKSIKLRHLENYDHRFSERFYQTSQNFTQRFRACFGKQFDDQKIDTKAYEIYVAESFDEYSIAKIVNWSNNENRKVRLVSYQFYPQDQYLEFKEVDL